MWYLLKSLLFYSGDPGDPGDLMKPAEEKREKAKMDERVRTLITQQRLIRFNW
jgi:hypothetical protein